VPAGELLLDFVQTELPELNYSKVTIQNIFYALRRFFGWLTEHHPEVYFLRQIKPEHFVAFQIQQALSQNAMNILCFAWQISAPFATARGHHIKTAAIAPDHYGFSKRSAPVYSDPLYLFQALDALAQNEDHPPLQRMLAHLLFLAAPSLNELCFASIPMHTTDGIPILHRRLTASRCIALAGFTESRGRRENYRALSNHTTVMPLRSETAYLALYAAVDAERHVILKQVDCPFLFVTSTQRISPETTASVQTIRNILKQTIAVAGLPDVNLALLRNTHALFVARNVSPRPAVIAAATGRGFVFATTILKSMDLHPNTGLQPLPKIALVPRYAEQIP
jgi:hypothetical protein